ncbi:MAG: arginine--tRNA ligase [Candidatus Marsarchaeota archaeon]|nr:arginine--tRNA ligase [Candidatus Marsarchaeota archaeon]
MMESPYLSVSRKIASYVESAAKSLGYDAAGSIDMMAISKASGDMSCSVAFKISKSKGEKPDEVADKIAKAMGNVAYVKSVSTENGYLNFHLDRSAFSEFVIRNIINADMAKVSDIGGNKKILIEYPSANPMHPIHVGHLRNMLIGNSVAALHDICGYNVERGDYIEDLGLQMVIAIWGYLGQNNKPDKKFDHWLGDIYATTNGMVEEPGFRDKISELAKKIEQGDTVETVIARELAEKCVRAQYETAASYGCYHDVLIWESDIVRERLVEKAMDMLTDKGFVLRPNDGEYKGCTIIDLKSVKDLPSEFAGLKEKVKVIIRKDGTPTYVAKDIAFHMWKFGMLEDAFKYSAFIDKQINGKPAYASGKSGMHMDFGHVSEAINIIDVSQNYPQALLRLAFRQMGRDDIANGIRHLSYGRVELEKGTLAARKGISMENTADGLLQESFERARGLIRDRLKLGEEEQESVARSVALSAIKFAFLKIATEKWITFSWKRVLTFEGDSGPYCQYMNARSTRLIEDSGINVKDMLNSNIALLSSDTEFNLVKAIARLKDVIEKACVEYRPNLVTEYAKDLAFAFSRFYETMPILKGSSPEEKKARLALVFAFRSAMRTSLGILGIDALDRM